MTSKIVISALIVMLCLSAHPSSAQSLDNCPEIGLTGPGKDRFCAEFRDLLYAPYNPSTTRSDGLRPDTRTTDLINTDALWGEVFRAHPSKTLDLIQRIRDAGGLSD